MSKIASEVVATTLNDWYIAIKKQKVHESIKYYSEIKSLFDDMEEDQEVLAYFSLLEERHKMLLHSSRGEPLQKHTYFTEENENFIKERTINWNITFIYSKQCTRHTTKIMIEQLTYMD